MKPWRSVHLTRARQVGELMELRASQMPAPDVPVRQHYSQLRASDTSQAIAFIGHALPRHEAIYWAAGLIDGQASQNDAAAERETLDQVRRWLENPSDAARRDVYAIAQRADRDAAERSLAMAIFYSGGSIAPIDVNPVQPAPGLSNRLAVVAVVQAAYRSGMHKAFFEDALHRAEEIAEHGIPARP